jgi:hypothetical protein
MSKEFESLGRPPIACKGDGAVAHPAPLLAGNPTGALRPRASGSLPRLSRVLLVLLLATWGCHSQQAARPDVGVNEMLQRLDHLLFRICATTEEIRQRIIAKGGVPTPHAAVCIDLGFSNE